MKEENTMHINKKKKTSKIFISVILILILFIFSIFFYYQKHLETNTQQFNQLLLETATDIYIRAKSSENLSTKILETSDNIMYNSLTFPKAFSQIIATYKNIGLYDEFLDAKSKIDNNMNLLSTLKPYDRQNEYDKLSDLYNAYCNLHDILINPTTSHNSYSAKCNQLSKNFLTSYNEFKATVPEIEEKVNSALKDIEIKNNDFEKSVFDKDKLLKYAQNIEKQIHNLLLNTFHEDFSLTFVEITELDTNKDGTNDSIGILYKFSEDTIHLQLTYDYSYNLKNVFLTDLTPRKEMNPNYFALCCAICDLREFEYTTVESIYAQAYITTPHENTVYNIGKTTILCFYKDTTEEQIFSCSINIKNNSTF